MKKKILVLGSGAREHAIASKFSESNKVSEVFVLPGNDGIGIDFSVSKAKDFEDLLNFIKNNQIDLVFVGNEQYLVEGVVNFLSKKGIHVIGPTKESAQIESSKVFSKNLMIEHGIPTAQYQRFENIDNALEFIKMIDTTGTNNNFCPKFPIVIKADGLAAGKGVLIAHNLDEAETFVKGILSGEMFGTAGNEIVIEEYLYGEEISVFAFCDGENFVSTIISQDHKKEFDDDLGLNTGGMGAFAPVSKFNHLKKKIDDIVFEPVLKAMKKTGFPFIGVLYAGLMISPSNKNEHNTKDHVADCPIINVIEFNSRFGDPETQVILPLLENDLFEVCEAILEKKIKNISLKWKDKYAVAVVMASKGYPRNFEKGHQILINKSLLKDKKLKIFYAGVESEKIAGNDFRIDGDKKDMEWINLKNSGGRVLSLVAIDDTLEKSINYVYKNITSIKSDNLRYRNDIGVKGLE